MHILLLGASGRTGQLILTEALSHNHRITALVRTPSSLAPNPNLTIIQGTPLNPSELRNAFTADPSSTPTVVIVALAARRASDSPFSPPSSDSPPRMMADSVANTIVAMKQHGVRKIIIMSSVGTGSSFASQNFVMRLLFTRSNMKYSREDHELVDKETREAGGVDFVIVRPAMLTDGEAREVKVYPGDGVGSGWWPSISRISVAKFMVKAAEGDEFVGKSPVIAN